MTGRSGALWAHRPTGAFTPTSSRSNHRDTQAPAGTIGDVLLNGPAPSTTTSHALTSRQPGVAMPGPVGPRS